MLPIAKRLVKGEQATSLCATAALTLLRSARPKKMVKGMQLPSVADEDYGAGWRFRTSYFDLREPIHRDTFAPDLVPLIAKYYPIDRRGYVRQGYFFRFNSQGIRVLLGKVREAVLDWLSVLRGQKS